MNLGDGDEKQREISVSQKDGKGSPGVLSSHWPSRVGGCTMGWSSGTWVGQ